MIREQLAKRLKEFRDRAGFTIYEVGEKIGKSGKTVSAWENGRGQPDADMLLSLCELYEIDSIADLYGENKNSSSLSIDEEELLRDYRLLSNQGKEFVRQTMVAALNTYKKDCAVSDMEIAREIV